MTGLAIFHGLRFIRFPFGFLFIFVYGVTEPVGKTFFLSLNLRNSANRSGRQDISSSGISDPSEKDGRKKGEERRRRRGTYAFPARERDATELREGYDQS